MSVFAPFHFLRPEWLVALLPAAILLWLTVRRGDVRQAWHTHVDPVLLDALLVEGQRQSRIGPVHMLGMFWLIGAVALAGPSWRLEPSPFAEDKAALVIVLKVTPSMLEDDIAPSRLIRAGHKITDLLERRRGARNALVAYAGSAHLVMPLTTDPEVINTFARDLTPDLMPAEGDNPAAALELATAQLTQSDSPGAILFVADDWDGHAIASLERHAQEVGIPVHVLGLLADERIAIGNGPAISALEEAANLGGGTFALITPDSTDVQTLAGQIQETARSSAAGTSDRWRDEGYWLLPLLALISGLWFRRGWVLA